MESWRGAQPEGSVLRQAAHVATVLYMPHSPVGDRLAKCMPHHFLMAGRPSNPTDVPLVPPAPPTPLRKHSSSAAEKAAESGGVRSRSSSRSVA